MAQVRILKDYKPAEGWRPGQIVDITNPWQLIKEGKVALVDEEGNEIENPDILMQIQSSLTSSEALELIGQLVDRHPKKDVILNALKGARKTQETPGEEVAEDRKEEEFVAPSDSTEEEELMAKVEAIRRKQAVKKATKAK